MSKELNVSEVATLVAEQVRKDINSGTLLDAKSVSAAVEAHVTEQLGTGLKGLTETIKLSVMQAIPKGSVYQDGKANGYNPEIGMKSVSASRMDEMKAELAVALMPRVELSTLANRCGLSLDTLAAAKTRVIEASQKTLSTQVGSAGGFAIPQEFIAEVQRKLVYASTFRNNVRVWSGVGLKGSIPKETGTVTVGYENELAQPTVTDLALGQVNWSLNKRFTLMALSGERGAADIVRSNDAAELAVDDAGCVTDIDTVQDLQRVAAENLAKRREAVDAAWKIVRQGAAEVTSVFEGPKAEPSTPTCSRNCAAPCSHTCASPGATRHRPSHPNR